jgi:hypothetical protein
MRRLNNALGRSRRASCWGIAGEAFAHLPHGGGDLGYRLLAAGLLMVTGVIDYDRLGPAMRAAYDQASNPTSKPTTDRS